MAAVHTTPIEWHQGEEEIHALLHVPDQDNPTSPGLSPHATHLLQKSSLLAVGTLDDRSRPWTTLLGGGPGFARPLGPSIVGVKTLVDRRHDPVVDVLVGGRQDGEVYEDGKGGRLMSALGIHLATRDRVKLSGKSVAGALINHESGSLTNERMVAELQTVFAIQWSLGNCPKYLNKKTIIHVVPQPVLLSESLPLVDSALALLAKADMFFISSSYEESSMGTNHRGGPPGFVLVEKNDVSGTTLTYPEYSGNRLYQTLGNLHTTPKAGLVFPDFDTGDVLYVTGETEIAIGKDAATVIPRSDLVVKVHIAAVRFVQRGLSFRGQNGERSPYNPPLRFLAKERAISDAQMNTSKVAYVQLLARELLTPTIARFRFSVSNPEVARRWTPGQYVALAFDNEFSVGYSHMRDDDPRSLNDDYVRTFTVSSTPGANLPKDEFEITIRNVGTVTKFLFRQNIRAGLELPLRGFGGDFSISQDPDEIVPFVAGGIGITPLLAQLQQLDLSRIRLFWALNIRDIGLSVDTLKRCPALAPSTKLFISGADEALQSENKIALDSLEQANTNFALRRILETDVQADEELSATWYLCTGTTLRKSLTTWLAGKKTVHEDFDY